LEPTPILNIGILEYRWNIGILNILNKESLQLESFLGLHDFSHDTFSHGFFPGQLVNGLHHLGIGFPLVLQILGFGIINIVLFGNPVKTIDPGISSR